MAKNTAEGGITVNQAVQDANLSPRPEQLSHED